MPVKARVIQKGDKWTAQKKVLGLWFNIGPEQVTEKEAQTLANNYLLINRGK